MKFRIRTRLLLHRIDPSTMSLIPSKVEVDEIMDFDHVPFAKEIQEAFEKHPKYRMHIIGWPDPIDIEPVQAEDEEV